MVPCQRHSFIGVSFYICIGGNMDNVVNIKSSLSKLKYSYLIKNYDKSNLCREELTRRTKTLMRKPNRRPNITIDNK